MTNYNEDQEVCRAFESLLYEIKALKIVEKNIKYQNNMALTKCKQEIEDLLETSQQYDDEAIG